MTDFPDLPEFTSAGRANILMSVARLSSGAYIEPPADKPTLPAFVWGLVIGAVVCGVVVAVTL